MSAALLLVIIARLELQGSGEGQEHDCLSRTRGGERAQEGDGEVLSDECSRRNISRGSSKRDRGICRYEPLVASGHETLLVTSFTPNIREPRSVGPPHRVLYRVCQLLAQRSRFCPEMLLDTWSDSWGKMDRPNIWSPSVTFEFLFRTKIPIRKSSL